MRHFHSIFKSKNKRIQDAFILKHTTVENLKRKRSRQNGQPKRRPMYKNTIHLVLCVLQSILSRRYADKCMLVVSKTQVQRI